MIFLIIGRFDENWNLLETYKTITDAYKKTNGSKISIIHCLKGRNKRSGGFKWKYIDLNQL